MGVSLSKPDVLIIGAGPVGLTLAIDLARRGVGVAMLETRRRGEAPSVKCNHVAARSMEIFRRLGVAPALRDAGLPPDYPNDVTYRTTMTGIELTRIPIPCRRSRFTATDGPDTWWPTPEPPHRINQIFLEPILFEHAWHTPGITIHNRTEFIDLAQDADGVSVVARDLDSGTGQTMRASYVIGCDGARSEVRRNIGVKLEGDAVVQRVQSSYIRAPDLLGRIKGAPAWCNFSLNPRRSGNVYAIDGRETWLVHNYLRPDEADFDSVNRDACLRTILGVGDDFRYEVLTHEDWFGRRLLADRFRVGRVFLCGDASHIWVPYAGYGMNAGIADAADLAWKLAGSLAGWGGDALLDAYEAERRPITDQVSRFAMDHAHAMARQRGTVPAEIEDDTPAGEVARATLGRSAYDLNVQQYCCAGLNFGAYYDASPLLQGDGEAHPPYAMGSFTASTVPGCRAPHVWLPDGRSLYDVTGDDHALLRLAPHVDAAPLLAAAATRGLPMRLHDVAVDDPAYRHRLVLVRPDQHVGWRGDAIPADPLALVDRLRGAA